jgi:hypothetical protein
MASDSNVYHADLHTGPGLPEHNDHHALEAAARDIPTAAQHDHAPEGFDVQVAHLSAEGQEQVHEAMHDASAHGEVTADQAQDILDHAKEADGHRENVEAAHHQQAEAADQGDYTHANAAAHQAEYEAHAVQDAGGDAGHQVIQAEHDQQALDSAHGHQQSAHDEAQAAQHYAEAGSEAAAQTAADHAAADAHAAHQQGHAGDQGGAQADHGYASGDSTGETHSE